MQPIRRITMRIILSSGLLALILVCSACQPPNALLRREGMEAIEQGNIDRARRKFAQAVEQDPTDWKSQYYLGFIKLEDGQSLDSQLTVEKAQALRTVKKDRLAITDAWAESLYQQGRTANLMAVLKQACNEYGETEDYIRHGSYQQKLGDMDGALLSFKKAARFANRKDPRPYVAMANLSAATGDKDNEIIALRYAYYVDPTDYALAQRFRKLGIVPGPTVALEPPNWERLLLMEEQALASAPTGQAAVDTPTPQKASTPPVVQEAIPVSEEQEQTQDSDEPQTVIDPESSPVTPPVGDK